eukprot:Phypoly_transcript_02348.p1 GENE.Phypoly_transcript_02348~~Phypoly_transcript_02348.p1  ORF type:complete len:858 (+),score=182.70 Phypoly_transcript_02348:213-2786(+)
MKDMVVANSTSQDEVYRSDGIRLYGLDAELELKMQSKRDKNYENELAKWIEQVIKEKLDNDDIAEALKSGIVLCKLLNAIQPGTVKNINLKPIALMQVENIQLYLKGCWNLGVPSSDLFVTSDLHNKKGIPQVLQNIVSLARVAQTIPEYKGPKFGAKLAAPAAVKKWETVETNQVVYATDMQAKSAGIQANVCAECGTQKKHLAKTCDKCGADFSKQGNIDVAQIMANLKNAKQQLEQLQAKCHKVEEENKKLEQNLAKFQSSKGEEENRKIEQLQSKYQKVEEENRKLLEQLKAIAKNNEKPAPTKVEPVKIEIKTEPAKTELKSTSTPSYTPKPAATPAKTEQKPATKFGQISYLPPSDAAPVRNFKIPAKSPSPTPSSTAASSTSSTTTPRPRSATTSSTPTPAPTSTHTSTHTPAKVETKLEVPVTSHYSNPQRNSGFGPRNLRGMTDSDTKSTSEPPKNDAEKRKLEQENARLIKDNAKLTSDYQNIERKYREELVKLKELDDKLRTVEKKLEASGEKSVKESRPTKNTQMATIRYRPSLRNRTNRSPGMANDLHKRLTRAPESFENIEFDIDPDMIRYAKDCMVQILFSKPIDFADVYALNELFSTDSGRRCFIQIMQATMKEIPTLVVSDNSFELLLYLINTVLQQMDVSDSKDLIAAKVLMLCACSLSRKSGETFEFVREFIHNYALWKDRNFWEEYFWDTLAKKHRKKYGEKITGVDKELTVTLIASFAYNMLNWGVSKEMAKSFSYEMAGINNISTAAVAHVDDVINNFQGIEVSKASTEVSQHKFHEKSFFKPTFCNHCHQFIWGIASKQGYKCEECKCKIHKKCLKDAQAALPCNSALKEVKLK